VLPFENRSAGAEGRELADALTDHVITAISRAAAFRVVARSSTQTYVGQAGDFRKLALDLGADYVLEGGVQETGDRVQVNARLIDTRQGHHVWADRYESTVADILDVENTLARSVTASIEMQIYVSRRPSEDGEMPVPHTVRDLIMRARGLLYNMTAESFAEATELAEQAIALEPESAGAYLVLAETHLHQLSMGIIPHDAANVAKGLELARKALALGPEDEWAHSFMAKAYSEANRLQEAIEEAERALEINPSLSVAIARLGECYALLGESEKAIEHCRLALKLNPRNPTNFWRHSSIALALFAAEDFEAVLHEARRVQAWRPDFLRGPILTAAALAALERPEEATVAVAACLSLRPELTVNTVVPRFMPRFARAADHARLLNLLRKAGLPDL
jgi:TolB-like protein/Tfp pilus assembly protein PilF